MATLTAEAPVAAGEPKAPAKKQGACQTPERWPDR